MAPAESSGQLVLKNLGVNTVGYKIQILVGLTKYLSQTKMLGQQNLGSKNCLGPNKLCVHKNILVPNMFESKKIIGPKKMLVTEIVVLKFVSKKCSPWPWEGRRDTVHKRSPADNFSI